MFETLFSYPAVLKRHREGPLAAERAAYLERLAAGGAARGTLLRQARYCRCVAQVLAHAPDAHAVEPWTEVEVDVQAAQWAALQVTKGRAAGPRWPRFQFRAVAVELLRSMGRLRELSPPPSPHHERVEEFLAAQGERWPSAATCRAGRWQVYAFLSFFDRQGRSLESVRPADVDAYFDHVSARWGRVSMRSAGKMLKTWFSYAERRGWVPVPVAATILLPRVYRHEGLAPGPTWEQVGCTIQRIEGDAPIALRDRALLMLLSTYGLRSGEVRRLQIDDLDWVGMQLRVVRSKSGQMQRLPLELGVGEAIARYLRHGRPRTALRDLFLTLRAPHRSLSAGGLYGVVERRLAAAATVMRGRGPHGLRHACARRLVESGRSFKEVGDHLGHRSPDATAIYAKVDMVSLRKVAFSDLGGLS